MAFEKDPNELGCLWLKTGQKGDYMTGAINGVNVICFPVQSSSPKAPTWRVLKSTPREDRQTAAQPPVSEPDETDIAF